MATNRTDRNASSPNRLRRNAQRAAVATGGGGGIATSTLLNTTAPLTGGGLLSTGLTLAIPLATTSANGYLGSTDWNTFNGKQAAGNYVSTGRVLNTTAPLTGGGDLTADRTLAIPLATTTANGYLSSTDWNTFNNKASGFKTLDVQGFSSISATNLLTTFYSFSIPGNTLGLTKQARLKISGSFVNNSGATAAYKLDAVLGTTTMLEDSIAGLATNALEHPWTMELILQNSGATNVQVCSLQHALLSSAATGVIGRGNLQNGSNIFLKLGGRGTPNIAEDTTTALTLALKVTMTQNNANCQFNVFTATLELLG